MDGDLMRFRRESDVVGRRTTRPLRRTDLSNPGFYSIEWTPSKQTTAVSSQRTRHNIKLMYFQEPALDQCLTANSLFWLLI